VIGGLSLGGYSSLAFHMAHPDRCDALILCDTGPGFKSDESRLAWNERANARAETWEREGLSALGDGPEVEYAKHRDASGLAHAARGMLAHEHSDVIVSLPDIKKPTAIIVGDEDKPFLGAADYMEAKIPGSRKFVISKAGHFSNLDNPGEFNAAMGDFLDGLPQ
jgi:pimeloyl-ACP methyl ester carboxylesterase